MRALAVMVALAGCAIDHDAKSPPPDAGVPSFTLHLQAVWLTVETPTVTAVSVDGRDVIPDQAADFIFEFPSFSDALVAPPVPASVTTADGVTHFTLEIDPEGVCRAAAGTGSPVVSETDDYVVSIAQMSIYFDPDCGECATVSGADERWCNRLRNP